MTDDPQRTEAPFLKRWSQRKLAAAREAAAAEVAERPQPAAPAAAAPASSPAQASTVAPPAGPELPAIESLTFDSDFTAFLKPDVAQSLRREALRKLFADPRFNVMDGLDVYIDDYGKFEPIPEAMIARLNQAKFLFDPPKTRVNASGHVEDVPPEEPVQIAAAAQVREGAAEKDTAAPASPSAGDTPSSSPPDSDAAPDDTAAAPPQAAREAG